MFICGSPLGGMRGIEVELILAIEGYGDGGMWRFGMFKCALDMINLGFLFDQYEG